MKIRIFPPFLMILLLVSIAAVLFFSPKKVNPNNKITIVVGQEAAFPLVYIADKKDTLRIRDLM